VLSPLLADLAQGARAETSRLYFNGMRMI